MNVLEELMEVGLVPRGTFKCWHTDIFERVGAELADDNSEISRKLAAILWQQARAWAELGHQVVGAERPDSVLARSVGNYSETSQVSEYRGLE